MFLIVLAWLIINLVSCSQGKEITKRKKKRSKKKLLKSDVKPDCSNQTEIFDESKQNNSIQDVRSDLNLNQMI